MKFKIYGEKDKDSVIRLRLVSNDNEVVLMAVDEKGEKLPFGNLLGIDSNGVTLYGSISKRLDLPLDSNGRLRCTKHES